MTNATIYDYYAVIKTILEKQSVHINPFTEQNQAIQALILKGSSSGKIRIQQSNNDTQVSVIDSSDPEFKKEIVFLLQNIRQEVETQHRATGSTSPAAPEEKEDTQNLIGVSVFGLNDFFGPLVFAGVHINPAIKKKLQQIQTQSFVITECEKETREQIISMSKEIMAHCPHSYLIIANDTLYDTQKAMNQYNAIVAFGHSRIISNIYSQKPVRTVISRYFGHTQMVKSTLAVNNIDVSCFQKQDKKKRIALSASKILAQALYYERMQNLTEIYNIPFTTGTYADVSPLYTQFLEKHDEPLAKHVAKLFLQ